MDQASSRIHRTNCWERKYDGQERRRTHRFLNGVAYGRDARSAVYLRGEEDAGLLGQLSRSFAERRASGSIETPSLMMASSVRLLHVSSQLAGRDTSRQTAMASRNKWLVRRFLHRGRVKECDVVWLLFSLAIVSLVVLAGRAHSHHLDRLQADPVRQLMLGLSFERSVPARVSRHRAWLQQATLDLS